MKKSSIKHKCLKCKIIPCINYYRKDKNANGELYILESTINKKLHMPCEFGALIHPLCQLLVPISDTLSFELFNQCIRDLKAASFLILTGHYRSAMQIMRPILENWLTGIYWDMKYSTSNVKLQKRIINEYEKFREDDKYEVLKEDWDNVFNSHLKHKKRYFNHEFLLGWLLKEQIINGRYNSKIQKKIGMLNKYLHPSFKETDISKPECTACPSSVVFNEEEYKKSVEIFQDISTLLLETFYEYINTFFEDKKGEAEEALDMVLDIEEIEKDIKRKNIYSKDLQNFISRIKGGLRNSSKVNS